MPKKITSSKKSTITQAVILAGGRGARLAPFSKALPKPLFPVGDQPIIEILARQLAAAGVRDIVVALGHGANLVRLFLGDGSQFGTRIRYVEEKTPRGTVGPLRYIEGLQKNFFVLNGDILANLNFTALARTHEKNGAVVTLAITSRTEKSDYGVVISEKGRVRQYKEKPRLRFDVSAGVYVFSRRTLQYIPRRRFDLPEIIEALLEADEKIDIHRISGPWFDIGRPVDWVAADRAMRLRPKAFLST